MSMKGKRKIVVLVYGVVIVILLWFIGDSWLELSEIRQSGLTRSIFNDLLSRSPHFALSVEEPPLEVGSLGRTSFEEKSSTEGTPAQFEDAIQCWIDLYHLTLQDVSSPVSGLPGAGWLVVKIVEESVFLDGAGPGRYRIDMTFKIPPDEYGKDVFDAVRVAGRPLRVREVATWFWPLERFLLSRGMGIILSNWGWSDVGGRVDLREFDPSEFVGIDVRRWGEAVPARWALLEPFPVAQIHAFDEKGWYRSVGYYRRGSVPERVVVHLYSSEGDLLMSVRTKAIKAGEGEKKPQRP
jgi:hypothetical protein